MVNTMAFGRKIHRGGAAIRPLPRSYPAGTRVARQKRASNPAPPGSTAASKIMMYMGIFAPIARASGRAVARVGKFGARGRSQEHLVGRDRADTEAEPRHRAGVAAVEAEHRRIFAVRAGAGDDPAGLGHKRRAARLGAPSVVQRDRQVRWADEHAVDPVDREDIVERIEGGARLDHRDRLYEAIGGVEILRSVEAAQGERRARTPRPLAERREFREGGKPRRIRSAVDHGGDDPGRARVEEAARDREFPNRRTDD